MSGLTQEAPDPFVSFVSELLPGLDLFLKERNRDREMGLRPMVLAGSIRELFFLMERKSVTKVLP